MAAAPAPEARWHPATWFTIDVGRLRPKFDILMERHRNKVRAKDSMAVGSAGEKVTLVVNNAPKTNYIYATAYLFLDKKTRKGTEIIELYLKAFCDRLPADSPDVKPYRLFAYADTVLQIDDHQCRDSYPVEEMMLVDHNQKGTEYMCALLNEFNHLDSYITVNVGLGYGYKEQMSR